MTVIVSTMRITTSDVEVATPRTPSFCNAPRQQQLDADEREDQRQTRRQVPEPVEQTGHEEVQGTKAEQCERVGGKDDERLVGHAENARDRV